MGRQKYVVSASLSGTAAEDVPMTVIIKIAWAMHFESLDAE